MIVAALMLLLAADTPVQADCAATAARGTDFMAVLSGEGRKVEKPNPHGGLDGTITHRPAQKNDMVPGTMVLNRAFVDYPADRVDDKASNTSEGVDATKSDDKQGAVTDTAGICGHDGHAA